MYKNLAFINGILLSVMIFLNGLLSNTTGPYLSTLLFHVIGLLTVLLLSMIKKSKLTIRNIPLKFFLPGFISVITIVLNNICIPKIGITLTVGLSLYGQLITSCFVEHFGFCGMPMIRFKKEKLLGMSLISLGVVAMIFI